LTNFGQYLVQNYFAALHGKRFLLSDVAQDLPALTDMHVGTLARNFIVLQFACLRLTRTFSYSLFVSFTLQPHTTSQSEYRLL